MCLGLQPSGKARDCNSLSTGSNPVGPSKKNKLDYIEFFLYIIARIIDLRDELELTQRVFSEKLGYTRSAYSLWELRKNTILLVYLNKISHEIKVKIDYLVYLSNERYIDFNNVDIDKKILRERI